MNHPSRKDPDSPGQIPASLGWISAHAVAAGESLAAWWLAPLARARLDAALMSQPASGKDDQEALREFVKPFRSAEEHADLIRKPIQASGRGNVAGIGAILQGGQAGLGAMIEAGVAGNGSSEENGPGFGKSRHPVEKGSTASVADGLSSIAAAGLADLFGGSGLSQRSENPVSTSGRRLTDGLSVESGNSTVRAANFASGKRTPRLPNPALVNLVTATFTAPPSPRPGSRDGLPARTNAKPMLPPAPTEFAVWAEKLTQEAMRKVMRKAASYASINAGSSSSHLNLPDGSGKSGTGEASPRRAPFISPEDPETTARFKSLMESQLGGKNGAKPGSAVPSDAGLAGSIPASPGSARGENGNVDGNRHPVTPMSHRHPDSARNPISGGPDLSDLVQDLYSPIGKTPSSPAAPGAGRASEGDNRLTPAQAPFSAQGGRNIPGGNGETSLPTPSTPRVPTVKIPTVDESHPLSGRGVAETEWLQEEDDLAAKLHRLLRRQAKRRGVDLA